MSLFPDLSDEQALHALTVLTRACKHDPDARHLLNQALTENLDELALPELRVAAQTGDPGHWFTSRCGVRRSAPTARAIPEAGRAVNHGAS